MKAKELLQKGDIVIVKSSHAVNLYLITNITQRKATSRTREKDWSFQRKIGPYMEWPRDEKAYMYDLKYDVLHQGDVLGPLIGSNITPGRYEEK